MIAAMPTSSSVLETDPSALDPDDVLSGYNATVRAIAAIGPLAGLSNDEVRQRLQAAEKFSAQARTGDFGSPP